VIVWRVPGGAAASAVISNVLTIIFLGGLLFFGYRVYMENREVIMGLDDRRRAILYAAAALLAITLVATSRMWNSGGLGALVWVMLIGAGVYAIYGVWRSYRTY
jgi:hypothetical protein